MCEYYGPFLPFWLGKTVRRFGHVRRVRDYKWAEGGNWYMVNVALDSTQLTEINEPTIAVIS